MSPSKCHIPSVYKSTNHLEDQVVSPNGAGQRCSHDKEMMLMKQTGSRCAHHTVQSCPAHQPPQHFGKCPQVPVRLQTRPRQELEDGWGAPGIPKPVSPSEVGWLHATPTMASPSVLPGYMSCRWQSPASEGTTVQNQEHLDAEEIFFSGA